MSLTGKALSSWAVWNIHSVVRGFTRWSVILIIFLSPWAYGSTSEWTKVWLTNYLLVTSVLWASTFSLARRLPRLPALPLAIVLALLGYGWLMVSNCYSVFDEVSRLFTLHAPRWEGLPGTFDQRTSLAQLLMLTGLGGAIFITLDAMSKPVWAKRLWVALAIAGLSIIVLGILQRVTNATYPFWEWGKRVDGNFFATYRYSANAGAFINLIIPLFVARAIWIFRAHANPASRVFWFIGSLIVCASAFINSSRAAMVIAAILILLIAGWQIWELRHQIRHRRSLWLAIGGLLLTLIITAYAFGLDAAEKKWTRGGDLLENDRYQVYEAIIKHVLPQSGWKGLGPGTFEITFPLYTRPLGGIFLFYWKEAHQDYLQTLIEWGWVGSALWAALIFGGIGVGLHRFFQDHRRLSTERRLLLGASCLALLGIAVHAAVDFPLQIASLRLYTAILLGIVWGIGLEPAPERKRKRSIRKPAPDSTLDSSKIAGTP